MRRSTAPGAREKFKAGPEWQHYTGTVEASLATQRAFGVDRGDKMSHPAVTLLRAAPGLSWLRSDGFVTPDELLDQYRQLLQEHAPRQWRLADPRKCGVQLPHSRVRALRKVVTLVTATPRSCTAT